MLNKGRLKKHSFKICVGRFHGKLLFSNLHLLLNKTQYSSDITSNLDRTSDSIEKIIGYILTNPKIRKIQIFGQSHSAEKFEKGTLWGFQTSILL